MSKLVVRVYVRLCVVKCMDMQGGIHSTKNPADIEQHFLLVSHNNREIKLTNHRKAMTKTQNRVIIRKR